LAPARTRPPATLVYNPTGGRRRHARHLDAVRTILSEGWELRVEATTVAGDAIAAARASAVRGDAVAFGWGGDGTFREVLEGILGSQTALGTIPGGTTNVVPRAIGLSADPRVAARRLLGARVERRDAGVVRGIDVANGVAFDHPFLMQATSGIDAMLMKSIRPHIKARYGFAGLLFEGARLLPRYSFPAFRVVVDGVAREVTGAGYSNMAQYAGTFEYVPGANWRDAAGHALLYTGRTRLQAVWFALLLAVGRHTRLGYVATMPAASYEIPDLSVAGLQCDGDVWPGAGPVTCRIAPGAARILLPEGSPL
jgi:diacylglycerol kinase family enzyme